MRSMYPARIGKRFLVDGARGSGRDSDRLSRIACHDPDRQYLVHPPDVSVKRPLRPGLRRFVRQVISGLIAPEYGCSKPDCTAEILEKMRCRFGFVRPETAVPFDDNLDSIRYIFRAGTKDKDGKIVSIPENIGTKNYGVEPVSRVH